MVDARAMRNDQFVEIPQQKAVERLLGETALREGQSHVEWNAAIWSSDASQRQQGVAKWMAWAWWVNLNQIIQDDCPRCAMKEDHFLTQWIALEGQLVQVS
jgi:hypothetical protein